MWTQDKSTALPGKRKPPGERGDCRECFDRLCVQGWRELEIFLFDTSGIVKERGSFVID
jgi:hypothetical protein